MATCSFNSEIKHTCCASWFFTGNNLSSRRMLIQYLPQLSNRLCISLTNGRIEIYAWATRVCNVVIRMYVKMSNHRTVDVYNREMREKKQHRFHSVTIVRCQMIITNMSRSFKDSALEIISLCCYSFAHLILMERKTSHWICVYWLCGCLCVSVTPLISSMFHAIEYDKHNCWFMKFMCLSVIRLWKPCV